MDADIRIPKEYITQHAKSMVRAPSNTMQTLTKLSQKIPLKN